MKDKVGIIYGLVDPRYAIIRYVGQTVKTLKKRFNEHIDEAKSKNNRNKPYYKLNWIRKLLSLNLEPTPVILAQDISVQFITFLQNDFSKHRFKIFYDYDELDKKEKYYIAIIKEKCETAKIKCVNIKNGGRGNAPWNMGLAKETTNNLKGNQKRGKDRKPPWNKGLTKEDPRVLQNIANLSKFLKGRVPWNKGLKGSVPWNKGLTKDIDSRVASFKMHKPHRKKSPCPSYYEAERATCEFLQQHKFICVHVISSLYKTVKQQTYKVVQNIANKMNMKQITIIKKGAHHPMIGFIEEKDVKYFKDRVLKINEEELRFLLSLDYFDCSSVRIDSTSL
jgi:hypothetical protein